MSWHESWMVVSDLDGTLLDHHTYSWQPAAAALKLLGDHSVPLVLASSKTLAEMRRLAAEMDLAWPLIVENGAAVAWPDGDGYRVEAMGSPREEVVVLARKLREQHGWKFTGFADWSAAEMAADSGLDEERAALALDRHGTEPIIWQDSEEHFKAFADALQEDGIRALRGGRYIHLMGSFDKVDGMRRVVAAIGADRGLEMKVVALGDSPNDVAMLNAADVAVRIRSAKSVEMSLNAACILEPEAPGPEGWAAAMQQWWRAQGSFLNDTHNHG